MKIGNLATMVIPKNTNTLLYEFNDDDLESCTCTVRVVNFGTSPAIIRFGFTSGTDVNTYDPYEARYELLPNESLERTKIIMSLYEKIICFSDSEHTSWRVTGYEENLPLM